MLMIEILIAVLRACICLLEIKGIVGLVVLYDYVILKLVVACVSDL